MARVVVAASADVESKEVAGAAGSGSCLWRGCAVYRRAMGKGASIKFTRAGTITTAIPGPHGMPAMPSCVGSVPNGIRRLQSLLILAAMSVALPAIGAETLVRIAGTGSATPVMEALAKAYSRKAPAVQVKVLLPPLGSSGAIRAVMAGGLEVAFSGKPPGPADQSKGARDAFLGVTPFMMVTREPGRLDNIQTERLADIYSGRVAVWHDGTPIRLILRSPEESDTKLLRELSPAMDRAMEQALARVGLPIAANDLENVALLEKTPGSFGMSNLALLMGLGSALHPVTLNGVAPTLANMEKGLYPHDKPLYLVWGPQASEAARNFIDFIRSSEGRKILSTQGYIPAKPTP